MEEILSNTFIAEVMEVLQTHAFHVDNPEIKRFGEIVNKERVIGELTDFEKALLSYEISIEVALKACTLSLEENPQDLNSEVKEMLEQNSEKRSAAQRLRISLLSIRLPKIRGASFAIRQKGIIEVTSIEQEVIKKN